MASPGDSKKLCDFPTPKGKYKTCHNVAGMATTHVGFGLCKKHGGTSPTNIKHAEILAARTTASALGVPRSIHPLEGILEACAKVAGQVDYYAKHIEELDPDATFVQPLTIVHRPIDLGKDGEDPNIRVEETTFGPITLNVWIKEYNAALDRWVKFQKQALDANVDIRLANVLDAKVQRTAMPLVALLRAFGHKLDTPDELALISKHFPDDPIEGTAVVEDEDVGVPE
jgi:hypothetical protein